jgi:hypothetical protein
VAAQSRECVSNAASEGTVRDPLEDWIFAGLAALAVATWAALFFLCGGVR